MFQKLLRFVLVLSVTTGILFLAHRWVLDSFFGVRNFDFLHFCYKFNFGITLLFISTIILAANKIKEQIGFLFLVEGMIKIGLLLYLVNILGFELHQTNFLVFFIPYLNCLVVGLIFAIKILKDVYPNDDG